MTDTKPGSKPFRLNKKDVTVGFAVFAATFFPIYANELLQNMDKIQNIVVDWFGAIGLPEIVELTIVPGVIALFVLARTFLRDNSK